MAISVLSCRDSPMFFIQEILKLKRKKIQVDAYDGPDSFLLQILGNVSG